MTRSPSHQLLLSLPPNMVRTLHAATSTEGNWFATHDPGDLRLGSGGGTAHLLVKAWRATGGGESFDEWLNGPRKLLIHGGGQSRRLPAYAAVGKPFLPMPILRHSFGQRLDQTLLDFQRPPYERVLAQAPPGYVAMVTSGDVLLRFGELPEPLPTVDVLALGMPVAPETAQGFGVFFSRRDAPAQVDFFRQKPTAQAIHALTRTHSFRVDTGVWLLSARAVRVLLGKCGWDPEAQTFAGGAPDAYELYSQFGLSLGAAPQVDDAAVGELSCAVVSLPQPQFYHLGTNRQLIEAVTQLQNRGARQEDGIFNPLHPDQFVQNAAFDVPVRRSANHTLWIENSTVPSSWRLGHEHILTGVPPNDWALTLEPGVCLDFVPIGDADWGLRVYGMDDAFSGPVGDDGTLWQGRPVGGWLADRGLDWERAGLDPRLDIQRAPLFPVMPRAAIEPHFLEWLWAASPESAPALAELWRRLPRLSAHDLSERANLPRLAAQRDGHRERAIPLMRQHGHQSVFFRLDLDATAGLIARHGLDIPPASADEAEDPLARAQAAMFRARVGRLRGEDDWGRNEEAAFRALREDLVQPDRLRVSPRRCILEDQIIWGRSPVRLDLAGGWTDTPPFCLQHGGRVVNMAVDLNGQPPIQVFAKLSERPALVLRSIDLGVEERLNTHEALNAYGEPGSEFALAKAALALAGFAPEFHAGAGGETLTEQLTRFGGGIELSLLAAIPKGSGLGTSSILAATLLATLSELCGLGWDNDALMHRSLVMEQMLTTGGGWQDPAGGAFHGVKLVESTPGLQQHLSVRWLSEHLFQEGSASKRRMLLYYTGLTRLAKNILQDIVRGMFLNAPRVLDPLAEIAYNAGRVCDAIGAGDYEGLCRAVARSWRANQALDAGTNPPAVQQILDAIADDGLAAAKLLGAGGGGYLLLLARDERAAQAIRDRLTQNPPNARARFVEFSLSNTGLQVTRS